MIRSTLALFTPQPIVPAGTASREEILARSGPRHVAQFWAMAGAWSLSLLGGPIVSTLVFVGFTVVHWQDYENLHESLEGARQP